MTQVPRIHSYFRASRPTVPFYSCPSLPYRTHIRPASHWGPIGPRSAPRYNRFSRAQRLHGLWNTSSTFRYGVGGAGIIIVVYIYANLERVPISGRLRFNCISSASEEAKSQQQLPAVLQEFKGKVLPPGHPDSKLVNKVVARLIPAAGLDGKNWEVRVINDPEQKNAFVIPGGKVFVFSGILPICASEDGLAAVLSHEIAHNIAHHNSEKISSKAILIALALAGSYFFDISAQLANLLVTFALERPGSRKMESEADFIGLLMMAQACYDPNAAVGLWERMSKAEQYAPPQLLSTHPASKNRVKTIREWLPQAEEKRAQSECGSMVGYADQFRQTFQRGDDGFW